MIYTELSSYHEIRSNGVKSFDVQDCISAGLVDRWISYEFYELRSGSPIQVVVLW